MKQYGKVIAKLRKQKGLTQQELGKRLNVSYQAVSKWENDLSEPDLSTLQQIVEIFEISIADFFAMAENPNIELKKEENIPVIKESVKIKGDTKPIPDNRAWYIVAGLAILVIALMFVAIFVPFRLSADRIYKKVSPSVFYVETKTLNGGTNYGTGFFINDSGLAVTDYSVINNCESGIIKQGEKEYNIKTLVGIDSDLDVAIIQIDIKKSKGVSIAKKVNVADRIYTISGSRSGESSLSETLISKVNYSNSAKYYQITTSASDGSAVVNEQGKVVGMISSGYSADAGMDTAIPIERILKIKRNINISLEEYFKNPFTLTFLNSNDEVIQTQTVRKGYILGEYKKTGYIVSGVYNDKNFTSKYNLKEEIHSSKNIYVDLRPIEYTINFLANGGNGVMASQHFKYDEEKPLNDCEYYLTNKMFSYWSWNYLYFDDEELVKNLTSKDGDVIEFKAIWTDLKYTITFDANGGSGTMSNLSYLYNSTGTLPSNRFSRTGYSFGGWEYNGNVYSAGDTIGALSDRESKFTFKAVWIPKKYTIKYVSGSTTLNTYEATFGEDFVLPDINYKNQDIDHMTYNGTTYHAGDVYNNLTSYSSTITFNVSLKGVSFTIHYYTDDTNYISRQYTWGNVSLPHYSWFENDKEGYTCSGFIAPKYDNKYFSPSYDFSSSTFNDAQYVVESNEILIFNVKWSPITYNVIIDNYSIDDQTISCEYDKEYTVPESTDYRDGYTLVNYNIRVDGNIVDTINVGEKFINLTSESRKNVYLKPNWKANEITMNFYNNGELWKTDIVEFDAYHTMPFFYPEEVDDMWFNGWMLDDSFIYPGKYYQVKYLNSEINFNAYWSKKLKGEGTAENPYQIETYDDLCSITHLFDNYHFRNKTVKLMNDIDCENKILPAIYLEYITFDGNNKVIKNVQFERALFGMASDSTIKNLGVENYNINYVGDKLKAFAGFVIAGYRTTIENCWCEGEINVVSYRSNEYEDVTIGGFCSWANTKVVIKNCYSKTEITFSKSNPNGISGYYTNIDIGGFIGSYSGIIENCYSITSCNTTEDFRAFLSYADTVTITNCFFGYYEGASNFLSDKTELEKFSYCIRNNDTITKVTLQDLYNLEYLNTNLNFDLNVWKKNEEDFPTLKSFGESI